MFFNRVRLGWFFIFKVSDYTCRGNNSTVVFYVSIYVMNQFLSKELVPVFSFSNCPPLCRELSEKYTRSHNDFNETFKFQTQISQACQYFLLKKMSEAFAVQKLLSIFQHFSLKKYVLLQVLVSLSIN